MKIAILADSHFGVRKNNPVFLESQLKFINGIMFPYLDANKIDTIIHCGDVYNNRNNLNINVINVVDELMVSKFNKYNTYLIVGNHDSYFRNTIDIHSLKPFRHLKNITVVDDIQKVNIGGKDILMVPWQTDNQKFVQQVAKKNLFCDICIGHFEINGFNLNTAKVCDFGISPDIFFNNYGITFSGHFHSRKMLTRGDSVIQYIANPYELTRSDYGQEKGFCVLDTDTMTYEFINNDVSIKHKKYTYPDKLNKTDIEGNIIDVLVNIGTSHNEQEFQKYMLEIESYKPFDVDLKLINNIDVKSNVDYKVQNTEELIEEYISDVEIDDDLKTKVNTKIIELYKQCKQED